MYVIFLICFLKDFHQKNRICFQRFLLVWFQLMFFFFEFLCKENKFVQNWHGKIIVDMSHLFHYYCLLMLVLQELSIKNEGKACCYFNANLDLLLLLFFMTLFLKLNFEMKKLLKINLLLALIFLHFLYYNIDYL